VPQPDECNAAVIQADPLNRWQIRGQQQPVQVRFNSRSTDGVRRDSQCNVAIEQKRLLPAEQCPALNIAPKPAVHPFKLFALHFASRTRVAR
jgi:hypothetical protein